MTPMRPVWLVSILVGIAALSIGTSADAPKTGDFETTFTQRSPLSEKKELLNRLAHKNADDYDLASLPFLVYVPTDYDAANAYGVIAWINHKDVSETPPKWKPV